MKENILIDKSIDFAARIIRLQRYLVKNEEGESLLKDCLEIKRLLISSINTAKQNIENPNNLCRHSCGGFLFVQIRSISKFILINHKIMRN